MGVLGGGRRRRVGSDTGGTDTLKWVLEDRESRWGAKDRTGVSLGRIERNVSLITKWDDWGKL